MNITNLSFTRWDKVYFKILLLTFINPKLSLKQYSFGLRKVSAL